MKQEPRHQAVITVDCHYEAPEHASAYLIVEKDAAAFVDNNTAHAIPYLLAALEQQGLRPDQVAYIIVTHLHLDHAGGTSLLAARCPNANVLAHPRGVRHLVDPARLIASVKGVYGEDEFNRLYVGGWTVGSHLRGALGPIDAARVRGVEDGESLRLGDRTLTFLHTRGHANHHICIHDSATNGVFTGDAFGVGRRPSLPSKRPFLICSTAPTGFDPAEARKSVRRILDTGAGRVYLAHFGELLQVKEGAEVIMRSIGQMETALNATIATDLSGDALRRFCEDEIRAAIEQHIEYCGAALDETARRQIETDIRINAQGLALAAEKIRAH